VTAPAPDGEEASSDLALWPVSIAGAGAKFPEHVKSDGRHLEFGSNVPTNAPAVSSFAPSSVRLRNC